MKPVNVRERVSQKGWRKRNRKLMKLGELGEFQSLRYGATITHPASDKAA